MQVAINARSINVRYRRKTILEGVSCRINTGEFVGVMGPNGAGKTTLLRAMLGLLPVAGGKVTRRGTVGYVPQQRAWQDSNVPISVIEIVTLGAAGDKARAHEALAKVGMEAAAGVRYTELSGGQQQRVGIAKALAGNADVLVLDEPTAGVDGHSQDEFYSLLQSLWDEGKTIIVVSHDIATMLGLVSRVVYLNRTILYDGPAERFSLAGFVGRGDRA